MYLTFYRIQPASIYAIFFKNEYFLKRYIYIGFELRRKQGMIRNLSMN